MVKITELPFRDHGMIDGRVSDKSMTLAREILRRMLRRKHIYIFLFAFCVRLLVIAKLHTYKDLDRYELERTAISLATTGVYGNPYSIPTGPTAHVSPGYTLILAGIFRVFGTGEPAEVVKNVLAAAITATECSLLPYFSQSIGIGIVPGLLAAVYRAGAPIKPLVELEGDWENTYTAIAIILLIGITRRIWQKSEFSRWDAMVTGLLSGVSLLFAAVLIPLIGAIALIQIIVLKAPSLRSRLAYTAWQLILVGVCLLPWVVRNELSLGVPIVGRSNFGLEFRVSNNDFATSDQRVNYILGVYHRYHPLQNVAEAKKVRALGEVEYNRRCQSEAMAWVKTHTAKFVALTLGRMRCFWFYPEVYLWRSLLDNFITVIGLIGLFLLSTRDKISALLVATGLFCYSSPSYLIHVGTRQSYPLQSILAVLAAYLITRMVAVMWPGRDFATLGGLIP